MQTPAAPVCRVIRIPKTDPLSEPADPRSIGCRGSARRGRVAALGPALLKRPRESWARAGGRNGPVVLRFVGLRAAPWPALSSQTAPSHAVHPTPTRVCHDGRRGAVRRCRGDQGSHGPPQPLSLTSPDVPNAPHDPRGPGSALHRRFARIARGPRTRYLGWRRRVRRPAAAGAVGAPPPPRGGRAVA